jgi:putative nucleotidyltransferase with HDIG domain
MFFGANRKSPRLAQWDGRRRSSRSDAVDWRAVFRRAVLARLAVVATACVALTLLVLGHGPPLTYRIGQTVPRDVRARVAFDMVDDPETTRLRDEAELKAQSTPADPQPVPATPLVVRRYPAGQVMLQRDQPISPDKLTVLKAEHAAYVRSLPREWLHARRVAVGLVVLSLAVIVGAYSVRFQPALAGNLGSVAGVSALVVLTFALAVRLSDNPWHAAVVPLTFTVMVLTVAYNPPFALFLSMCLAILLALTQGTDLTPLLVLLGGLGTAVLAMREVRSRSRPVEVGVAAGLAFAVTTAAAEILTGQTLRFVLIDASRNFLGAVIAGCILTGCLHWVERAFGIVTDVTLLELADSSHPLLQELIRRAPGTYTHSMTVATLAEPAAEAIGANPLLTRVGCYFHDIGKMLKPHYFIENQAGQNAHDQLGPALSTLVIIGHVKDGLALAEQYRLPRPLLDFIHQHHGTTLVEYFFREAVRLSAGDATADGLEPSFRYPGPKPQTREACILMLADAAESAARALPTPTATALRKLVHDLSTKRLLDGQFDESGLTLSELRVVEEAVCKGLIALYHARVRYAEENGQPVKSA